MQFSRRNFLVAATAVPFLRAAAPERSLIYLSASAPERLRAFARRTNTDVIDHLAASALKAGPWSVTAHRPSHLDVPVNDFVSDAPYFWPDPKDPKAAYVRKDGEHYADRFQTNVNDLRSMCSAVLSLGMGAYLLGRRECASHAERVLTTWFLDPKTRMNPNLQHAQMIRGVNQGRGAGQIDSVPLTHAAQGIVLLELSGGFDSGVSNDVRRWYADYLNWMMTSDHGKSERKTGNNHSTWWTVQAAAHAAFTGNTEVRQFAWNRFRDYLVSAEIQPDGDCPREEARTRSLHYSTMNLDAFSLLCRLAQNDGVDLWSYRTSRGIGVETAFRYLLPYVLDPAKWKKQQIDQFNQGEHYYPGVAGIGMPSSDLWKAYLSLPRDRSAWVQFLDVALRAEAA